MSTHKTLRCSKCEKLLKVPIKAESFRVRCPQCEAILQVRGAEQAVPQEVPFGFDSPAPVPVRAMPSPAARPMASPAAQPMPKSVRRGSATRTAKPRWFFAVVAGAIAVPVIFGGVLIWALSNRDGAQPLRSPDAPFAQATPPTAQPFEPGVLIAPPAPGSSAVPAALEASFPELGAIETQFPSGVVSHFVQLTGAPGTPASQMTMRVYIPRGQHQPQTLPCVLVAPAGTPLLHGASVDRGEEYHDETLPYADAGMVVILYSLDGEVSERESVNEETMFRAMMSAYPRFRAAEAGVQNGRTALSYAITKLPMVDPNRIYCAGHSSAGNVSLLLAAAEPKINRCVAYAAAYDFESRMEGVGSDPPTAAAFPGIASFIRETSPTNGIARIHCPVMVFHARDDDNVPYRDAETYVAKLRAAGKDVNFVSSRAGGHYSPMLSEGIPAAITWLSQR